MNSIIKRPLGSAKKDLAVKHLIVSQITAAIQALANKGESVAC